MIGRLVPLLAVAVLAACGGDSVGKEPGLQGTPRESVTDLDNILALRSDFEADAGKTRVIILLSPT